jgi:ABC-type sulfate/molybdate transport systems ATPase subunit
VSIARALVLAPRIVLLDEPFSALDAPTRAELLADLRDIFGSIGASALLVTHDRHEAAAIGDRVAILHDGALRQLGAAAAVLDHPADADCARLLGFENLLEPALASRLLGKPASQAVAVRARDVAVLPGGDMGVVERVLPLGERTRIATLVGGVRVLGDVRDPQVAAGDRVDLRAAVAAARVIARG